MPISKESIHLYTSKYSNMAKNKYMEHHIQRQSGNIMKNKIKINGASYPKAIW